MKLLLALLLVVTLTPPLPAPIPLRVVTVPDPELALEKDLERLSLEDHWGLVPMVCREWRYAMEGAE